MCFTSRGIMLSRVPMFFVNKTNVSSFLLLGQPAQEPRPGRGQSSQKSRNILVDNIKCCCSQQKH